MLHYSLPAAEWASERRGHSPNFESPTRVLSRMRIVHKGEARWWLISGQFVVIFRRLCGHSTKNGFGRQTKRYFIHQGIVYVRKTDWHSSDKPCFGDRFMTASCFWRKSDRPTTAMSLLVDVFVCSLYRLPVFLLLRFRLTSRCLVIT